MQSNIFLVFDLDGTISDPVSGVSRCLNYSLNAFGFPELEMSEVYQFIGPPLDITFKDITGLTSKKLISDMVTKYRERYGQIGYAENTLYPGIYDAIHYIASKQIPMIICTSKRADFAEKVIELFHLREFFSFISGGDIGVKKVEQLRSLLENKIIDKNAIMIGDRAVDILAARAIGIRSVGVLWGYGSKRELEEAFPDKLLETPEQLKDLIMFDESLTQDKE